MKLVHEKQATNKKMIKSYTEDVIQINEEPYRQPIFITPHSVLTLPIGSFDELDSSMLSDLLSNLQDAQHVELLIIGTGKKQRFLSPETQHKLYQRHTSVESMTTASACRTYNVLVQDGRKAAAILFL